MKNIEFLLGANVSIWLIIFGYILFLFRKNKALKADIEQLKARLKRENYNEQ